MKICSERFNLRRLFIHSSQQVDSKAVDDIKDRLRSKSSTSYSPFFGTQTKELNKIDLYTPHEMGRFPTNFVATRGNESFCPLDKLDEQKGKKVSHFFKSFKVSDDKFYYSSKPTKNEKGEFNDHPTVKPLNLMRYLIKMITPPKGTVLDPFMGSGTTGVSALFEGFSFVGIEKEEDYFKICKKRLICANKYSKTKS